MTRGGSSFQGGKRHHFIGASDPTGLTQVAGQRYRAPSDWRRCGLESADKGGVVLAAGSERGGLGPANIPRVLHPYSHPALIPRVSILTLDDLQENIRQS